MRNILIILGSVVVLLLGAGGYYYWQNQPSAPVSTTPPPPSAAAMATAREKIDSAFRIAPIFQPFFERFKSLYPADFDRYLQSEVLALASGTESVPTPDTLVLDAVELLRNSRGAQAALASPEMLDHFFDIQAQVLDTLAVQDARLCDHFLFGGDAPAFGEFSSHNQALISQMAEAGLNAIADGEAKKITRDPPADEDFTALEKSLTDAKLEPVEIGALLDGQLPEQPFAPARTCAIGKIYYASLKAMPAAAKYNIYALALQNMAQ